MGIYRREAKGILASPIAILLIPILALRAHRRWILVALSAID
jgi:hypothetical protein